MSTDGTDAAPSAASALALLLGACERRDTAPALRWAPSGAAWSYAELDAAARTIAGGLAALGLAPGDRLALLTRPRPAVVAILLAALRAGVTLVPLNDRYRLDEVTHVLRDCEAAALIADGEGLALTDALVHGDTAPLPALRRIALPADPAADLDAAAATLAPLEHAAAGAVPYATLWSAPALTARAGGPEHDDDCGLIIYTSGTTGRSKGARLPVRALAHAAWALTARWELDARARVVLALPLFHVHGLCVALQGALVRGASVTLLPRFDVDGVVAAFEAGDDVFMGVPTMYARLLERLESEGDAAARAAAALGRARLFTAGSAAVGLPLIERFRARTGHTIVERYGMTETLITLANGIGAACRPGTVGWPVEGVQARLVDERGAPLPDSAIDEVGELEVRGPTVMLGYYEPSHSRVPSPAPAPPLRAASDGGPPWLSTGDMARRDREGMFTIVGRMSTDLIKSGGFKIGALEIEACLAAHPAVAEVAVIGLPDPTWGERIAAAVVLHPAAADADAGPELAAQLRNWCRARLADFKTPRELQFVAALPRNAMGKVQKRALLAAWPAAEPQYIG